MCADEGNRKEALAAGALAVVVMYVDHIYLVFVSHLLRRFANAATADASLHSECAALLCCLCGQ